MYLKQKSSKMKTNFYKRIFSTLFALTSLLASQAFSQSVVCRKEWISGFENEVKIGHAICGENTSKMSETKIYLTVKDDQLYVQSNYVTPGYENPTKLATSDKMGTIDEIAMNIFFTEYPSNGLEQLLNNARKIFGNVELREIAVEMN
jgi:hypothetical protein